MRRVLATGLLTALLTVVPVGSVLCGEFGFTDLRYPIGQMGIVFNSSHKGLDCAFTLPPEMDGKRLSSASFFVRLIVGEPFALTGELRADSGGLPGALLAQESVYPYSNYSWNAVSLGGYTMQAGVQYHFVVRAPEGIPNSSRYIIVSYMVGRYRQDMKTILNWGDGWFANPNADPCLTLSFTDGTTFGQPYWNWLDGGEVYGAGSHNRCGERFVLSSDMTVRRVSLIVFKIGSPPGNLRVGIWDESSGDTLVEEEMATPDDVSNGLWNWYSHTFATPVSLAAGRAYRLYATQDEGQGDSNNCYKIGWQPAWNSSLTFGGSSCCAYSSNGQYGGSLSTKTDVYFKLHSEGVQLVRVTPFLVTGSSVTIVAESAAPTNATLEYGPTTQYGSSLASEGQVKHTFNLTGLAPDTVYHYRIALADPNDPADTLTCEDSHFRTDAPDGTVTVAVTGDIQDLDSKANLSLMATYPHDIVVTTGDMVGLEELPDNQVTYAVGMRHWRWVLADLTPVVRNAPLFTCLGNHDDYFHGRPEPLQAFGDSVMNPLNGSGDGRYYSFDYGPAHFVVLVTSTGIEGTDGVGPSQRAWLLDDLAASSKPWKIAVMHRNCYGLAESDLSNTWRPPDYADVHAALVAGGVNVVFQGHRHVYNRFAKDGIFYVTTSLPTLAGWSGGGDSTAGFEQTSSAMPVKPNYNGDPGTIPAYIAKPGWVQLEISPATLRSDFVDSFGRVIDTFTLPYVEPPPSGPPAVAIGAAKQRPPGSSVAVTGSVTCAPTDSLARLYIEDEKTRSGMRVISGNPPLLTRGQIVRVTGTTDVWSGESVINADTVAVIGSEAPLRPLNIRAVDVGGSAFGDMPGVTYGFGLNNTGLLSRVVGKVKSVDTQDRAFYVEDGSETPADNGLYNLKVSAPPGAVLPVTGTWVAATGISGCQYAYGIIYPTLYVRDQNDIVVVPGS